MGAWASESTKKRWFAFIVWVAILPAYCRAAENGAILRTQGQVRLNGNPGAASSAIFPNAVIETEKGSVALIEATGSRIEIGEESAVEFDGDELKLEHGSLSVLTFRGMKVRIGCISAIPVRTDETRYDISDRNGWVTVAANKNDVNIERSPRSARSAGEAAHSGQVTVREGEQKSWDENCTGPALETHTIPPATAAWMNTAYAKAAAAAVIIGVVCWVFCTNSNPASPSTP